MTKELLSYLKFGNRFYGVELTQVNGDDKYYGVVLKKKRKELYIQTSFEASHIEVFKNYIPKGKPIFLVINTDSVLTKKVEYAANESLKLVHLAFPNIKVEDFYYEHITQGNNHFVSICRKTYVDELLRNYASNHITILNFTLGSLVCSSLSDFIDTEGIQTSNSLISVANHQITEIRSVPIEEQVVYNINGLDISNNQVLGFAAALYLVTQVQKIQSSFTETKTQLNNTFKEKQFANLFLKIGLSFLFVVLLINFLYFNHYYDRVNTLRETSQVLKSSKIRMVRLNEKVQKTQKVVDDVLKGSASNSSFFIDNIINSLPKSILLKEFNYQPLLKKIKEDKPIENLENIIIISGESDERIKFSQWISKLENFEWIKSVEIINFEDITPSLSKFKIKFNMRDDTKN